MYIECQQCHANNHINTECINCHATLTHHVAHKKPLLAYLLKTVIAGILLIIIALFAYEYHFRNTLFPQASRNAISQEYTAIDACIKKFYTHHNSLSICSQALEKTQAEYPETTEINPVILNAFAEIYSQQLR